jgi:outer membrane protein OmpA-like peptidoglycan-associated protein/tetratricopeptide (TPR) repeat protein
MIVTRTILLLVLLLQMLGAFAQGNADPLIREADKHFEEMAYARAIEKYQAAADLGAINDHVAKRLAQCHLKLGNTVEAERWYSIVVKFLNRDPSDLYNYAQALKSNGRYDEAEEWMDQYLRTIDPQGTTRSNISGFAKKFIQDQDRFKIRSVSLNSSFSDFGTAWLGSDKVMFSSSRKDPVGIERRAAWNDQPFLDLYIADVNGDGDLMNARPLPGKVNSKLHEGPATAATDGDVIWFTRNNYFKGRSQKSQQGISRLSIFKAYEQMGQYTGIEQFLYNNSEISIGHPALSPDGKSLYFVSDMPGGFGGTDIYVCHEQNGQWGEPRNLGGAVNTAYHESFPFISNDGTLYFSSNGHPGLGGHDVFAAAPANKGGFRAAMNVGAPVNSSKDDFSFIIDKEGRKGFFSSNRPGGMGDDDIYGFEMLRPLEESYLVTGVVMDKETDSPVVAAEVELLDESKKVIATAQTDNNGEYAFPVEKQRAYRVVARMPGRHEAQGHLSTQNIEQDQIVTRDLTFISDEGILLRGAVREKGTIQFIPEMTVSVVNLSSFYSESHRTDESGDFHFRIQGNEEFEVHFEKEGYFSQTVPLSTNGMKQGILDLNDVRDLSFEPVAIGKTIPLKHVRFGEGKPVLDPVAKTELDLLVERMLVNPTLLIEIAVHSDTRGNATEKQKQTQKQADVIAEYLFKNGVPKERVAAKGYGGSQPLNHCTSGTDCTDAEHAENRRVEYKIADIKQ